MVKKAKSGKASKEKQILAFDPIYNSFVGYIADLSPAARKKRSILSLIVAFVLASLASVPPFIPSIADSSFATIASVLLGTPAGLIVYLNLVYFVHFGFLSNTKIASYRSQTPPEKRLKTMSIAGVVIMIAFIVSNSTLPYGLGGALIIAVALTLFSVARRTPEETARAAAGIPDPRTEEGN